MGEDPVVFTVGHSNHPVGAFLMLLRQHGITDVFDVRRAPYSRYVPHFSKRRLEALLASEGIGYQYMGDRLGGPATAGGDFEGIRNTDVYSEGLDRIAVDAESKRIALVCSERHPMDCHRYVLLGRDLKTLGLRVVHILSDGSTVTQTDLEGDMLNEFFGEVIQTSLFSDTEPERLLQEAYRRQGEILRGKGEGS